ncbi:hypothetical protein ANCCEY_08469 [Ancylostoma ceylanicum]|uniref:Integrase catalytic domain-containing protein n=1 Tax=Ancylostoma ceylanicum TaxID=53326 RepID=A0A0D6LQZ0_9BILA|nr:hypothetical protein ANCCEY_08469 [Ancylostoma ceylanicum]
MELLAARNCVFLAQFLVKELDFNISHIHFFSDSQITLHWIHSSKPLKQFVHNRVTAIRKILDQFQKQGISTKFHYVASEDNPADCATRGIPTDANADMWWNGPSFLRDSPENWPNGGMDFSTAPVATSEQDQEFAQSIPSLKDLSSGNIITAQDFQLAETLLIREHYRESEHAIGQLHLDRLNAHRDELGLIRCPARMENAPFTSPVLLVPSHPLTKLVILQAHTSLYHQGVYGKFLRTCVVCKKVNGRAYRYPDMPSLPKERVTRSRPFQKRHRRHQVEAVDLSYHMYGYKSARRGTPDLVYSDNATTFHAGEDALNKLFFEHRSWNRIQEFSTIHKITWKFITPVSPWKGGFYERLVALFKSAFSKAIGIQLLKLDQIHTVVVEIEAVINSRPITPYREKDPSFHVLRPCDFISPEVTLQLPPGENTSDIGFEGHRLTEWYKDTTQVLDCFWNIWYSEYLSALAQRHQRRLRQSQYTHTHPSVNDVVIIGNDNVPRGQWRLGIVIRLLSDKKGVVRSAEISAQDDYIPKPKAKKSSSPTRIQPPRKVKRPDQLTYSHLLLTMERSHGTFPLKKSKTTKPTTSAAAVQPHTRPPTVLELISAIAKGQNVNRRFDCETDNDTQAFSVPRSHRHILQLTQLLTLSLNPDHVFNPTHLGQHDYVLVDSFLHSDFFQQIRSIFTKEIYVPSSSEVTGIQSQHLPILVVAQALTALTSLSQKATTYLQELSTQGQPTPDVMLARLWALHRYAENILQRRTMIHTQLLPIIFSQPSEIQTMVNLLASYGVTYSKIVTAVATSAAVHAEIVKIYDLYHKLLTEHFRSQSDSQITLHWIHSSKPLKQFVHNRVIAIRKILDQFQKQGISTKFHYVASEDNPADCATRGIPTDANADMWWNGPSFLRDSPENWPNGGMDFSTPPVATSEQDQEFAQSIPSLKDLSSGNIITAQDFQLAEALLIREHYRESEHAIGQLHLDRLNAHRDELGLIRCPARMENAPFTSPVLLVPSHPLTKLVILQAHTSLYHQGVYGKFLRTCVVCKKVNGRAYRYPDMPSLPKERVTRSRPFQKRHRRHQVEAVDLSYHMYGYKSARRGTPDLVYSDNATTFHAGEDALNKLFFEHRSWNRIQEFSTIHKITWKFITPVSPWKGGFYERLVALFKSAFSKAIGIQLLKLDQIHTVVVEIEAVINSRPITPYREKDPSFHVLRPCDFISPEVTLQLPPGENTSDIGFEGHRLTEWYKDTTQVLDCFWNIWYSEYLSALAQRHQRRLRQSQYTHTHPSVNDVVIIGNDNVPRGQWRLGIVIRLLSDKKGVVRSAEVRTSKGKSFTRSITHLYPLEISAQDDYIPKPKAKKSSSPTRIQPPRKVISSVA